MLSSKMSTRCLDGVCEYQNQTPCVESYLRLLILVIRGILLSVGRLLLLLRPSLPLALLRRRRTVAALLVALSWIPAHGEVLRRLT